MIKDNQAIFNRLHVILDAAIIGGAYALAWFFKFKSGLISYSIGLPTRYYFRALYYIIPGYLYLYYVFLDGDCGPLGIL